MSRGSRAETTLRAAFEEAVAETPLTPADAALVEAGRKLADRLDAAIESGVDVTKALYLTPHFLNVLREMLATPASRHAAGLVAKESTGGKLAQLRLSQKPRPA